MLDFRNVDHSVLLKVSSLFTTPTADLTSAWNVYGEDNFANDSFVPVYPYIFILESKARPRISRLPMLIIERAPVSWSPYEIGARGGSDFAYSLHVFARNRGERSDLAAYLYKNLDTVPLYDFSTTPSTLVFTAQIYNRFSVTNAVGPDVGMEGALSNWESISISFQTLSP